MLLLLLGAGVALISARQFRQIAKNLEPEVVPPGYWTQVGVGLNIIIALIALAFAVRFVWAGRISKKRRPDHPVLCRAAGALLVRSLFAVA